MQLLPSSRGRSLWGAAFAACVWLSAAAVHAHPVPAQPPDFGMPECITVVDKRTTDSVALDYFVGFDDVMEEPDHIPVPDQKTHQFFAFRGQLSGEDPQYFYWPFDPSLPARIEMPLWINQADLGACEALNTPMIAPQFSPEIIGTDTLTERPEFSEQWLNVREMRVPITERQALLGLRWPLADVPTGVYQIAGYIYSPPFNAWERRPGVIKVIDGERDVPALTVDSIDAMLFGGQGRKVSGCVDAPSGSELRAYYRTTETEGADWQMWASQPLDDTGMFELCYHSPSAGFSGILEMRIVVASPQGEESAAYAPDRLVVVSSPAKCSESAKLCCDDTQPEAPEVAASAPSVDMVDAGHMATADAADAMPTLTQAVATTAQPAADAPMTTTATAEKAGGGCSVSTARSGRANGWGALMLLAMAALRAAWRIFRPRSVASRSAARRRTLVSRRGSSTL